MNIYAPFLNLEHFYKWLVDLFGGLTLYGLIQWILNFIEAIKPYSTILALLLLAGIIYCVSKIRQIERDTHVSLYPASSLGGKTVVSTEDRNEKWERIEKHISSDNLNDWKMAIIEADTMLDELVSGLGYHGETLGERMKAIEPSDFATIENAWEAHKIRNTVAHEGGDYVLTSRDARRAIHLYKTVFEEFKLI